LTLEVRHVERLGHEAFAYGSIAGAAGHAMFCARIAGAEPALGSQVGLKLVGPVLPFDVDGARLSL
jgi:hypothetical protein